MKAFAVTMMTTALVSASPLDVLLRSALANYSGKEGSKKLQAWDWSNYMNNGATDPTSVYTWLNGDVGVMYQFPLESVEDFSFTQQLAAFVGGK